MLKLILMGLLMRGPNHGYNLRKIIEEELSSLINVDNTSIYYTLNKLEKEGLVTHDTISDTKRPQKNLYTLSDRGKREFKDLLLTNMSNNKRPLLNIDISLYFIDMIDRNEAVGRLTSRTKELRKLIFLIKAQEKNAHKENPTGKETVILSHNRRLAETELQFLRDVLNSLKTD
ncbi:MAG: helix-turn-helix transcriptional regulator [Deltaproteobacteria bacterium]|nr:helix-turn-helix transcriptional regulator [Candidatus Zymogenaceae bacterium]